MMMSFSWARYSFLLLFPLLFLYSFYFDALCIFLLNNTITDHHHRNFDGSTRHDDDGILNMLLILILMLNARIKCVANIR